MAGSPRDVRRGRVIRLQRLPQSYPVTSRSETNRSAVFAPACLTVLRRPDADLTSNRYVSVLFDRDRGGMQMKASTRSGWCTGARTPPGAIDHEGPGR